MKHISLTFDPANIPVELQQFPQWVNWCVEMRNGEPTKPPIDPRTGRYARSDDPSTWTDYGTAMRAALAHARGLGFVFTHTDPFVGIDLDKCRDPNTGALAPWAVVVIHLFASYAEVSPSGTGIKIFIKGTFSDSGKRRGPIELYRSGRYFTLTGRILPDASRKIEPRQRELDALRARLAPPPRDRIVIRSPAHLHHHDDDQLIQHALGAGNGERFRSLWEGRWTGLYPSQSEADAALVAMLAYWCDGDPDRIDALFRRSALCRPKWTEREDYRERTIKRVLH